MALASLHHLPPHLPRPGCRAAEPGRRVPARHEPLACLTEVGLDGRFGAWRGASGRRYVVTVYQPDAAPEGPDGVVLAVRRDPDGTRRIVGAAVGGAVPDADEVHVHLLAREPAARRAVLADLVGA